MEQKHQRTYRMNAKSFRHHEILTSTLLFKFKFLKNSRHNPPNNHPYRVQPAPALVCSFNHNFQPTKASGLTQDNTFNLPVRLRLHTLMLRFLIPARAINGMNGYLEWGQLYNYKLMDPSGSQCYCLFPHTFNS